MPNESSRDLSERVATYRFSNEEISSQLTDLHGFGRNVDTKATLVAGVSAGAFPFLLTRTSSVSWTLAMIAYGASLFLAVTSLWPRRWFALQPAELVRDYDLASPALAIGRVAATKAHIYDLNYVITRAKVRWWVASVACFVTGIVIAVAAALTEA